MRLGVVGGVAAVVALAAWAGGAEVTLRNEVWAVRVDPATLGVRAREVEVSAAQEGLGVVEGLEVAGASAEWRYVKSGIRVRAELKGDALVVGFVAERAGAVTFPVVAGKGVENWLLPCFEGLSVPAGDGEWVREMVARGAMDTTADLSMPFVGARSGAGVVTYLLTNPFGNELVFRDDGGRLGAAVTHRFRENWKVKEYGVEISLGAGHVLEPAWRYRKWLKDRGEFVSLKEKIGRLPEVGKLVGAAHVYLWGGDAVTPGDVRDFKGLVRGLVGTRVYGLLSGEVREAIGKLGEAEFVDNYTKTLITGDLSRVMREGGVTPEELVAAVPGVFEPVGTWGDGASARMIGELKEAGLDRVRVVVSDMADLRGNVGAIGAAREAGYLIGPYDSFHSIHPRGMEGAWETAQFDDPSLYEAGAIVKADGTKYKGFQQKGHLLSPAAARPHVEGRVAEWMKGLPGVNLWFVDCDAFGQVYDDYSPTHPATQADDTRERLSRLGWIRDTYQCVIGSEGGSSYAAGAVHFAEGIQTPVIGWGDAEMHKEKGSKYYLGAYWPPGAPAVFFKPVPMKPAYKKFYFDPRYRVPLYQAALHDSVVTTHHWSFGSLKLSDLVGVRGVMELLYGVPPLYHLNRAEFAKRREAIVAQYAAFSPLHREVATEAMTDFGYLTGDRLVQRTRFGEMVEVVGNFSEGEFKYRGTAVPAGAVGIFRKGGGDPVIYRPAK